MLRSNLCDYSDAYIVVKGTIDLLFDAVNKNHKNEKGVALKSNAPFTSWISKINSTLIDEAEDLGTVMPMYNLLEYSQNYSMTSGNLWKYYRDEIKDDDNKRSGNEGDTNRLPVASLNIEVTISLKYFSNFLRFLDLSAIDKL